MLSLIKTMGFFGAILCLTACAGGTNNNFRVSKLINSVDVLADFEKNLDHWDFKDKGCWKRSKVKGGNHVLNLFKKKSPYHPTFRSPRHVALLKGNAVGSFTLDVKAKSTHKDYPHRDLCLFFNYQNEKQFYYVHLGQRADDKANQIFIVNHAARKKISITSTRGTPWDKKWHRVRVKRDIKTGMIEIYFDDMKKPAMTAKDDTFKSGRIGLGSFDDTGYFDEVHLVGEKVK